MNKLELLRLLSEGGFSRKIIKAFAKISRESFVLPQHINLSYDDIALPLDEGATISQPSTIAFMLKLLELKGKEKILEIGSGSGYVLALLDELTIGKIYGVEIIKNLALKSAKKLKRMTRIKVSYRDGKEGLIEHAPFDRILVSASSKEISKNLLNQLSENGILVAPVRNSIFQIKKAKGKFTEKEFEGFVFVPLR